jgi:cobalamin biosynthesis Mg chelatase CobN
MYEGEIRDITAYVSGNGVVTAEIWADEKNISALKLYDGTTETQSPLSFTSTNTSERIITVKVKALSEGTTGILTYRINGNDVTKTYTTQISIGSPESPDEEGSGGIPIMQIIIVVIVLLVIIYMIVTYLRNRKR